LAFGEFVTRSAAASQASVSPGTRMATCRRETTTVDHLAFEIALADFEAEKGRLEQRGLGVWTAEHAWVGWRSLYFEDPEGHTVELVCYDTAVR
jgi:hypothetical protein